MPKGVVAVVGTVLDAYSMVITERRGVFLRATQELLEEWDVRCADQDIQLQRFNHQLVHERSHQAGLEAFQPLPNFTDQVTFLDQQIDGCLDIGELGYLIQLPLPTFFEEAGKVGAVQQHFLHMPRKCLQLAMRQPFECVQIQREVGILFFPLTGIALKQWKHRFSQRSQVDLGQVGLQRLEVEFAYFL